MAEVKTQKDLDFERKHEEDLRRISHPGGQETVYAHMQYLYVRAGEVVSAGQCLGTAGQTGRSTGAHLHCEFLTQGLRYDPAKALGLP